MLNHKLSNKKEDKNQTFLWTLFKMLFNFLKAAEPLQQDSLILTINVPGIPVTHLIDLGRMKDWLNIDVVKSL